MSDAYKKKPNQAYTILRRKIPVGFVIFKKFPITEENKSDDYFIEMALDPTVAGKGIGLAVINLIMRLRPKRRTNWSMCASNLPSMKLLQKLGGGIHGKYTASNGEKVYKGYFRLGDEVDETMRRRLSAAIEEAKPLYTQWKKHFDGKRKRKLSALAAILL